MKKKISDKAKAKLIQERLYLHEISKDLEKQILRDKYFLNKEK